MKQEIQIDEQALQIAIANDKTIKDLEAQKAVWDRRQAEKRKRYEARIGELRSEITTLKLQIVAIKKKISSRRGEIGRCKAHAKYRKDGIIRIERRINKRKSQIRRQFIRRAIALARKRLSRVISL